MGSLGCGIPKVARPVLVISDWMPSNAKQDSAGTKLNFKWLVVTRFAQNSYSLE